MRVKWLELLEKARAAGLRIRATSGLRTGAEQDALYAQGRTTPGAIVTNARAGSSAHNKGAAVDFAFEKTDGRLSWNDSEPWDQVGALAESIGLSWGGRWTTFKDRPHVELSSWRDLPTV